MLSTGASNALLKTLEEPPGHVVFVLATTNPEKVLPTIRSRTQHFEFRLLTAEELAAHLATVLEAEEIPSEPDALGHIARRAAGSARDALSLLDQAIAHSPDRLTVEEVDAALGGIAFDTRLGILDAVADEDVAGALVALHALLDAGHDARRVADDLLGALRDAFLTVAAAGRVRVEASDDQLDALRATATRFGNAGLVRAIETLGTAIVDMRGGGAPDAQLVLEVALLRLARRDAATPLQALAERVERLERQLAAGGVPAAPATASPPPARDAPAAPATTSPPPAASADPVPPTSGTPAGGAKRTLGALRKERGATNASGPDAGPAGGAPPPAPPAPEDAPTEPTPTDTGASFTLDDVVVAWSAALETMPLAVRRGVEPAQPIKVEGPVITFGIPPTRFDTVNARFRQEAMTIRTALTERLDASPKFTTVHHDAIGGGPAPEDGPGAAPSEPPVDAAADPDAAAPPEPATAKRRRPRDIAPPPDDAAPAGDPPDDADDWADPDDLVDAPSDRAAAVDSLTRLQDAFGATVVEEHARDNA